MREIHYNHVFFLDELFDESMRYPIHKNNLTSKRKMT